MENKSAWRTLMESIQFCIDSKRKRYSLEAYLEMVGKYTDNIILQAEDAGLDYVGGECIVKNGQIIS